MGNKLVKLIAGANGIWTGTARVEPGEAFEVPEAQAEYLIGVGAATPAPAPLEESAKGSKTKKEAKAKKGAE